MLQGRVVAAGACTESTSQRTRLARISGPMTVASCAVVARPVPFAGRSGKLFDPVSGPRWQVSRTRRAMVVARRGCLVAVYPLALLKIRDFGAAPNDQPNVRATANGRDKNCWSN